ncbi:DUF6232 family protein [Actinoplanes sp. NPDC026623]|uniref:DUF6232 family protein n=1 Tax=Actinoplanes sp. NPDC026623 TaxID=3155610 RepID=UPI0033CE920B
MCQFGAAAGEGGGVGGQLREPAPVLGPRAGGLRVLQHHPVRGVEAAARRAAATAAMSLPVVLAAGPRLPLPMTLAMLAVLVALPSALAVLRARLRPPSHLLWADVQGRPAQLYATRDATEFGRISRALLRASAP